MVGKVKVDKKGNMKQVEGQGTLSSIILWSVGQAPLFLSEQPEFQCIFFISPWSTGKTLCKREKGRMRARKNPQEKLHFAVIRDLGTKKRTLLELELADYFKDLVNVTVLGIPSDTKDTPRDLLQWMASRPGSWMLDELVMPEAKHHQAWSRELQQMRAHMLAQPGHPLLWLTLAGIDQGKPEHFALAYLAPLLAGFYLPGLEVPLRNTRGVFDLAGLAGSTGTAHVTGMRSNPVYRMVDHLMPGVKCREFPVKDWKDRAEVEARVEEASREVMARTGGGAFPVIFTDTYDDKAWPWVAAAVGRATGRRVLSYRWGHQEASEGEVEAWLQGTRHSCLVTDRYMTRGWETPHLLVISLHGLDSYRNCVMRTIGYCALVRCTRP